MANGLLYDDESGILAEVPEASGDPGILDRLKEGYKHLGAPEEAEGAYRFTANPLLQMGLGILASQADRRKNAFSGVLEGLGVSQRAQEDMQRGDIAKAAEARRVADHEFETDKREKLKALGPQVGGVLADVPEIPDELSDALGLLAEVDPARAMTLAMNYRTTALANPQGKVHGAMRENPDTGTYWALRQDGTAFDTKIKFQERWRSVTDKNGVSWLVDSRPAPGTTPQAIRLQSNQDVAATRKTLEDAERRDEAVRSLPSVSMEYQRLSNLTNEMLTHPGRALGTGPESLLTQYGIGTDVYDFTQRKNQLMTSTPFIQGIKDLKAEAGGIGPITEVEGLKIQGMVARANAAVSDHDFIAATRDLQEYMHNSYNEARRKAGLPPEPLKIQYLKGERIKDDDTGEWYTYIGPEPASETDMANPNNYQKVD